MHDNLRRKSEQASEMFAMLVKHMNQAEGLNVNNSYVNEIEVPQWLKAA